MNNRMYEHPATQANLRDARERGVHDRRARTSGAWPQRASRASDAWPSRRGCSRPARQRSPDAPEARPPRRAPARWQGLRVLVTAGGTREPIDSVRFIGNSSSGRMGFALARAAHARGAEVTLVAANVALAQPAGVGAGRGQHRRRAAARLRQEFPRCDVLLMAAAVADFTPAHAARARSRRTDASGLSWCSSPPPTCSRASRLAAARPDARRLRGRARRRRRRNARAASSPPRGSTRSSSTTSPATDIGFDVEQPTRSRSSAARERRRRSSVATCRAPTRPRSPRRSSTPSARCARSG